MTRDRTIPRTGFETSLGSQQFSFDPEALALIQQMRRERNQEELRSFKQLTERYVDGVDYHVTHRVGETGYLFAAWHGGMIERGSDVLAELTAGSEHSLYLFKALQSAPDRHPLRITSIRFDDARLLELARVSTMVVSFHCCTTLEGYRIFIGGGAPSQLKNDLIDHLRNHDFNAGLDRIFPGMHPSNPCNIGNRPGIQIEISQRYMDRILERPESLQRLAGALRSFTSSLVVGR